MKHVLIPIGCRSDEGLSAPVIKRLQKEDWCEVKIVRLEPQDFMCSYQIMDIACKAKNHVGVYNQKKPDLVFITGDRVEMCAAAAAAFHNKVKIAHFYGGVVNDPKTTYDDTDRDVISLWADIHFVESCNAAWKVHKLKGYHSEYFKVCSKLQSLGIHIVGISHLDDLEVDELLVPRLKDPVGISYIDNLKSGDLIQKYDLLLLNKEIYSYNFAGYSKCLDRLQIQIGGNPDGIVEPQEGAIYYENLPRAQFFGLLKNCQRFITNSSCAIYEAPHFIKPEQIVWVGDRNRNRARGPFQTGASDKIVTILKEYLK